MKKFRVSNYMIRPIIQKAVTRILLVIVLCMLWDRFLNKENIYTAFELPLLICGVFLLAGAWIGYLRLDGFSIHYLGEDRTIINKKKKHKGERSVVDFVDEKVVAYEELELEEQITCGLVANLLVGGISLLIAVIASFC